MRKFSITVLLLLAACAAPPATPHSNVTTEESPTSPTPSERVEPSPSPTPEGETIIVTNTTDSDPGSLRDALNSAEAFDTIIFDPGVFPPNTPATISVTSELPHIHQGNLTIDGSNAGVILDGENLEDDTWQFGFGIVSNHNSILGLQIINFPGPGIALFSGSQYNTIGGDRTIGIPPLGQGNQISGNRSVGVFVDNSSFNSIIGNSIGTDPSGSQALGNDYDGVYIVNGSNNEITRNSIFATTASGIKIDGQKSFANTVIENLIGVDVNHSLFMGNEASGVVIMQGAHNNVIGPDNIIANTNSFQNAVEVYGSETIENTITQNRIFDSRWIGIDLWGGGNLELAPPIILSYDLNAGSISGLAYPDAKVEFYSLDNDNWSYYLDDVAADPDGYFEITNHSSVAKQRIIVTATDSFGNTSEYSIITDGTEGSVYLQDHEPKKIIRVETYTSNELDDNRIGTYWHNLWENVPLATIYDQAHFLGLKRFRFAIDNKESVNEVIEDHDDFLASLEKNGILLTMQMSLYETIYNLDKGEEPIEVEDFCLRFDSTRADYEQELAYYLDHVEFIVEHFKGRIQYYEIWNEPDNPACYLGVDVDDYITLVIETAKVIKKVQQKYPAEMQNVKIKLGGIILRPGEEYLLKLLRTEELMERVDVISWHPFYGDSPDTYPVYYARYPEIIANMKETAAAHGFGGEYHAEEMNWRPHYDAEIDLTHPSHDEIAYAKYWARGILMHLGLDVIAGSLEIPHYYVVASNMVRNLSATMPGYSAKNMDNVKFGPPGENIASYAFSATNGDVLFTLWKNGVAVDHDPGDRMELAFPGLTAGKVVGIDVLYGFEQELDFHFDSEGNLIIPDLMVKDFPIIIKFTN